LASIVYLFGHLEDVRSGEEKCVRAASAAGAGDQGWGCRKGCGASVLLSGPNDEHSVGADTTLSHGRAGPRHPRQGRASTTDPNCAYKVSCADILALAVRDVIS
ncbi:hypothetical protein BDA96_08G096500, partial [Sorghum bicolor]